MTEVPAVRASNAEREQTVRTLREHCVAGRLTLETVLQELPRAAAPERRRPKRLTFGAFGGFERRGPRASGRSTSGVSHPGMKGGYRDIIRALREAAA